MEGSLGVCSERESINGGETKAKDGAGFASCEQMGCVVEQALRMCANSNSDCHLGVH